MNELAPGTVCYIVKSEHLPEFNGFVVEVVTPWPQEPGEW